MTFTNAVVYVEEIASRERCNGVSNKLKSKIQNKKIWKSLRTHIMSSRKKNKLGEFFSYYNLQDSLINRTSYHTSKSLMNFTGLPLIIK